MKIPMIRESFSLPYNNGEIWCEQMDCLGNDSALIVDKFDRDAMQIARPSTSARIILALHETVLDAQTTSYMVARLVKSSASLQMVAIVGADAQTTRLLKNELRQFPKKCAVAFFPDYEPAKKWLIP